MRRRHASVTPMQVSKRLLYFVGLLLLFVTITATSFFVSFTGSNSKMSSLVSSIKEMTRSTERFARYRSHSMFLSKCLAHKVIPKGMQLKYGTDALPRVPFLRDRIAQTMLTASLDIMGSCSETYSSLAKEERANIDRIMFDIHQTHGYYEFEMARGVQNKTYSRLKYKLAKKKNRKFAQLTASKDTEVTPNVITKRRCRRFKRRYSTGRHETTDAAVRSSGHREYGRQPFGCPTHACTVHCPGTWT